MKALTIQQADLLPVSRRWVPGHKRLITPNADGGYLAGCKCGWNASEPCTKKVGAYELYGQHFRSVATSVEAQSLVVRSALRVHGHRSEIRPLGEITRRRTCPAGWATSCICGWHYGTPSRTRRDAQDVYGEHLDQTAVGEWPACKRCKQLTRPSRMSKSSPHLCKTCRTAATQEWAQANPQDWERARRRSHLKKRYGLTPEEADQLLESQGGKCAICGTPHGDSRGFRLHIDHDHATGAVRGILCNLCNAGLGNFRDDPVLMRRAIAYLAANRQEEVA